MIYLKTEQIKQSQKEYWIRVRLSDLYFGHYEATMEEIQTKIDTNVNNLITKALG